ncbi:hypothetical protein HSX11_10380 [Oxalobacteraceae bacterium]|nr:hypothetical protein [Oxalobacteraceae bacterium]
MKADRPLHRPHSAPAQIVVGILVIGLGLLLLLDNLGLLDFRYSLHFWPLVLVFFGIIKVVQSRSTASVMVGGALILFGVLLTLRAVGLIYFSFRVLWPVLMILAGVAVVYRSITGRRIFEQRPRAAAQTTDDRVINVTAVMGGFVRRVNSDDFRGGEITALMGGCELDLRQCSINGEAVLNVFAMFGGIQIKVPADWTVVLQGTPVVGGFDEKTAAPPDGSKRLLIKGYAIMGGLEVRN